MLRLLLFALIAMACVGRVTAQSNGNARCPTVNFKDELNLRGSPAKFAIGITNSTADSKLDYFWTVSNGSIIDGINGSSITVEYEPDLSSPLTATVRVGGFPAGCPDTFSYESFLITCILPRKFDEFGAISWSNTKARLDNLAIEFNNNHGVNIHLTTYGGRESFPGEAEYYGNRAKNYLVNERKVPADHVIVTDGGYKEQSWLEVWLLPPSADPPSGYPTVDRSEVVFTKSAPQRKRAD